MAFLDRPTRAKLQGLASGDPDYVAKSSWLDANLPHDDAPSFFGGLRRMFADKAMADPDSDLAGRAASAGVTQDFFGQWARLEDVRRAKAAAKGKQDFLAVAALAGGAALGASGALGGAAAGEPVAMDFSYLDALEAGDAWAGGEEFVSAAAAASAPVAPTLFDRALDAGMDLAKKYAAQEIASRFAPAAAQRDISSRAPSAPGVPLVRYSGQPGDALGTLFSPAALKTVLTLGVVGLVGALAWRIARK